MKKILFVDDEKINLMLFKVNFRKKFEVFTAETARQAIATLEEHDDINVVITDMKMPKMSGIELAELINSRFRNKAVYLLTGFGPMPEIEHALKQGFIKGHFVKPLNFEEFEQTIEAEI